MDPELPAYLEAMTARMDSIGQRAVARDAVTRKALETLDTKIDEARREAGVLFESSIHEINLKCACLS